MQKRNINKTSLTTMTVDHYQQKLEKYNQMINTLQSTISNDLTLSIQQSHEHDNNSTISSTSIIENIEEMQEKQNKTKNHIQMNTEIINNIDKMKSMIDEYVNVFDLLKNELMKQNEEITKESFHNMENMFEIFKQQIKEMSVCGSQIGLNQSQVQSRRESISEKQVVSMERFQISEIRNENTNLSSVEHMNNLNNLNNVEQQKQIEKNQLEKIIDKEGVKEHGKMIEENNQNENKEKEMNEEDSDDDSTTTSESEDNQSVTVIEKQPESMENQNDQQNNENEQNNQSVMIESYLEGKNGERIKQLEEWTGKKVVSILFDSDNDNCEINSSDFDSKLLDKEQFVIMIESNDIYFGGYSNAKVKKNGDYIVDSQSFLFTFKDNEAMKFDLLPNRQTHSFCMYPSHEKLLFTYGLNDLHIYKQMSRIICKQTQTSSYNYNGIENALIGKASDIYSRIIVYQLQASD